MGKRQQITYLQGLTADELQKLIDDPRTPTKVRQDAITQQKYIGERRSRQTRDRRKRST